MKIGIGILLGVVSATVASAVFFASSASAATLLNETFTGNSTASGQWSYGGNSVCLTAGSSATPMSSVPACDAAGIDTPGNGVLRLTDNQVGRHGFVLLNTPLNSLQGFSVTFDMYQYGTTSPLPADGIGFILVDGSYSPTTTVGGGSLGYGVNVYRQDSATYDISGIVGGYAGVGLDSYGNYSTTSCPTIASNNTCQGFSPNSLGVRGPASSQYQLASTKPASGSLSSASMTRDPALRTVKVTVSPAQVMTVAVDYHDGRGSVVELERVNITELSGSSVYPSTFKLGFSGSTGAFVNYHEIKNLTVETLAPDLATTIETPVATLPTNSTVDVTVKVSNSDTAAPTLGDITSTTVFPAGIIPQTASGNGWTCTVSGQTVTCVRPGAGANALLSGASAPPITIRTQTGEQPLTNVSITTTAATTQDDDLTNNTASATVSTAADAPGVPNTGMPNVMNMVIVASIAALVLLGGVVAAFRRSQAQR